MAKSDLDDYIAKLSTATPLDEREVCDLCSKAQEILCKGKTH